MRTRVLVSAAILTLLLAAGLFPQNASALTLDHGTPIVLIDGDTDGNTTVDVLSAGGTSTLDYGFFLNGGSTFFDVTGAAIITFNGGDIADFALYDGSKYYTLSGDVADSSYSVQMTFANDVTVGSAQQPLSGWGTFPDYFYNVNITWTLPDVINTNEVALNFINNGNDGLAPVPEPSTLLLLGSGLVGLGYFSRKRKLA